MTARDFTPEQLLEARQLYEDGIVPVEAVAATLGMSKRTLYDHIGPWGWTSRAKLRQARRARAENIARTKDDHDDTLPDLAPDVDATTLARRLDEVVRRELAGAETRLRRGPVATAERNARVLSALVKALSELTRMERQERDAQADDHESQDDASTPSDLAELRTELAKRLEGLRRARNAGSR